MRVLFGQFNCLSASLVFKKTPSLLDNTIAAE